MNIEVTDIDSFEHEYEGTIVRIRYECKDCGDEDGLSVYNMNEFIHSSATELAIFHHSSDCSKLQKESE